MTVRSFAFPTETIRPIADKSYTLIDPRAATIWGSGESRRGSRHIGGFYRQNGTLRGPVDRIVHAVSSLSVQTYRVKRQATNAKAFRDQVRRDIRTNRAARDEYLKRGEIEPVDHPALTLLQRPQSPVGRLGPLNQHSLIEVLVANLLLFGEFFVYNVGTGLFGSAPTELEPIPPPWVRATRGTMRNDTWEVEGPRDRRMVGLTSEQLTWVRHPDPSDPEARATGIAMTLADELDTDESAAQYSAGLFRNGGVPSVIVSLKGYRAGGGDLSKAAKARWEEEFRQRFSGVKKAGGVYVHDSDIDVKQTSFSPVDLNVIEIRKDIFVKVLQVIGLPPEMMGVLDNSNKATITVSREMMAEIVVSPIVALLEGWLNDGLLPLFNSTDGSVFFAFESAMPVDVEQRDKARIAAPWTMNAGEWREVQGLGPLENEEANKAHALPSTSIIVSEEGLAMEAGRSEEEPEEEPDTSDPVEIDGGDDKAGPDGEVKVISQLELERAIVGVREVALRRRLSPLMRRELTAWIARITRDLGAQIPADTMRSLVGAFLADFSSDRIVRINQTTAVKLRRSLALAVRSGKSKEDIVRNIQRIMGATEGRARTIARTEVHRAVSWSEYHVHRLSGVVAERQWIVIPDKKLRDAHAGMAGQIRKMNDPFTAPSGERAFYPTGFSVAKLDINCRCRAIPITTAITSRQAQAEWTKADALERGFRRRMVSAIMEAFEEQIAEVRAVVEGLEIRA